MTNQSRKLANLATTHTLLSAALPGVFTKLPWAGDTGSWSAVSGWSPSAFLTLQKAGSRSGLYWNVEKLKGTAGVMLTAPETLYTQSNERQFSVWLFTEAGANPSGYQLVLWQSTNSASPYFYAFKLRKWVGGVETLLKEVTNVYMEPGGAFGLSVADGVLQMHVRRNEAGLMRIVGSATDTTFTEGYAGIDGNGSNPRLTNFATGALPALGLATPRVAVNREFPPARHAVIVRDPGGQAVARWAEDEGRVENVLGGLKTSGVMPGGRKELRVSLPRNPRFEYQDLKQLYDIECLQDGRERIWHGRLSKTPRTDGDRINIDGEAVGWGAALEDRKGIRAGMIDSDMGKWGDPSTARRSALINTYGIRVVASTSLGFSPLDLTNPAPAIINDFTGVVPNTGYIEAGEADYYSGGVDIGGIYYDYDQLTNFAASAEWFSTMALDVEDTFANTTLGTNHQRTNVVQTQQSVFAPSTGHKYARLTDRFEGAAAGGNLTDVISWQNIRVLSWLAVENLLLRGTWPNVGYTAAQMLRVLVPAFSKLRATESSVEDDGFIIQQAWWADPGTLAAIVDYLVGFGLYDWFVKDQRLFELRKPGTYGRRWQAYQGPANFEEADVDSERAWDRLIVAYQDADGTTRYVGYPGSGCETESAALQITDPDHPAVRAEVPREDILALNVSSPARALEAGERWLAEANELSRSGKCTLSGYAMDDKGVMRPVGQIAEGDLIRFPDARDKSYRKVVGYDYDATERKVSVDLDAPSESVKALLERYGAVLARLGFNT